MTGRCAYGDRSGPFEFVRVVGYCAASVRRRRRAQRHWGLTTGESWALFYWSEPEGEEDEEKARVQLAGGFRPRPDPAQQDEDRRLQARAGARAAAALEL